MGQFGDRPNFADCLTVGEAAKYLGVSSATLRNWDRSGKLRPRRHPQNGYRIYLHEDLESVLRTAELATIAEDSLAPVVDWSAIREDEHFVQFYEHDHYLIEAASGFVAAALVRNEGSIVVATSEHRAALQRSLVAGGIDVAAHVEAGRCVVLDAAETLERLMVDGELNRERFVEAAGTMIAQAGQGGRRVHAFGEMVAILWSQGKRDAAMLLEEWWGELGKRHRFALLCAYPIASFDQADDCDSFRNICNCHSRVLPTESYSAIEEADARLREIGALQQKAGSLAAEIEHRQEVEKALAKRERELVDFFENGTEGLHKVGADGTILWANRADYELLGYAREEYIGQLIQSFHADADVIDDMLLKLRNGETLRNYPARLRSKNGDIKHVLVSSNACFEDGRFAYTRCFTRDVTQLHEAEERLRESVRRKDEFLATLSHELRNPLAPIRNSLEVLRRDPGAKADEEAFAEARDVIERQVNQMTRLVDDLLDVSRVSRDKLELRKERVDLATVLRNAVETSQPVIDAAGHELTVTLPNKPLLIDADPTRLSQVFANLLNNAAKYTEPGGRIYFSARQAGAEVIVSVRDTGIGIACEELAHVFDMFHQAGRSLELSQGGLGIGLTLVRKLVELHGGTVNVQSEGLGKGSEFVVQLPLASKDSSLKTEARSDAANGVKKRILVVDDNADAGRTLSILLKLDGHEVRTAHNGLEAVEVTEQFSPDVILMDVGMPKLNGYDATRRIRQMPGGDKIFIVALTGWGQTTDKAQSAEAGCSAHLVKPVEYPALKQLLARECSN